MKKSKIMVMFGVLLSIVFAMLSVNAAPSITFEEGTLLEMTINVDDSAESANFYLLNDGNVSLLDIEIDLDTLFRGKDDDIDDDDFEINGEPGDETYEIDQDEGKNFELRPNETYKIKLTLDIPSNLDVDDYRGDVDVSYLPKGATTRVKETFTLKIIAESDDDDVFIEQNSLYVKNGVLTIFGEPGETVNDYEIIIVNDASYDVENLRLELDGNLENEDGNGILLSSAITFDPNPIDVFDRDEEKVDVEIVIPDDQQIGTYVGDIELFSSSGKQLDKITLRVEVVGDIYVKDIKMPATVTPGSDMDVEVTLKNQGSKIHRNVKVYGNIFDIDSGNSDLYESTNNFIMNIGEEKTVKLRFNIPVDANDGEHTLEIRVLNEDGELVELEEVNVVRPATKIVVQSFAINPPVVQCDKEMYTYIKFQNLGKYDKEVKVSAEIEGTNIKKTSNNIDFDVDDIVQQNLILDVSTLEAGTYTVVQKINYGTSFIKEESTLKVLECKTNGGGVVIKPIEDTNTTGTNETSDDEVVLLGKEIDKTTIYLGSGLAILVIFIIIGLFLL